MTKDPVWPRQKRTRVAWSHWTPHLLSLEHTGRLLESLLPQRSLDSLIDEAQVMDVSDMRLQDAGNSLSSLELLRKNQEPGINPNPEVTGMWLPGVLLIHLPGMVLSSH